MNKEHLFDKVILACKDEILNTTKTTSVVDKKAMDTYINEHIHKMITVLLTLFQ